MRTRPNTYYRRTPDRTVLRDTGRRDPGGIYDGTVGWEDGEDHFDLEDSGAALIKVTLFKGRNPDIDDAKTDRAQGRRILARIDPEMDDIPPDGTQVLVAVAAGRSISSDGVILKSVRPDAKFVPLRKPGEKIQLGPASNFMRMHADGVMSLCTRTENTDKGKSVYLQVRPDGFRLVHPLVKCTLDATGFHVNHASGARVDMGAVSGLPAPLDTLGSYVALSAALVRIEGAAVMLGTAAGVGTPVARSDQVILALGEIMGPLMAAVVTAVGATGGPGSSAAATALATAVSTLATAMAGIEALIPSTSTMVT